MAEACGVRTSLTRVLNSSIMASVTSPPFSLARDFCSEPRWSMAAAAMTPRSVETLFRPANFPGVSFIGFLHECAKQPIVNQMTEEIGGMRRGCVPRFQFRTCLRRGNVTVNRGVLTLPGDSASNPEHFSAKESGGRRAGPILRQLP